MKVYFLQIPANVHTWRGFDFQTAPVFVAASSLKAAARIVNRNKNAVLAHLRTYRLGPLRQGIRGKHLISFTQPPERNVFFHETYYGKPIGASYNPKALFADGEFKRVDTDEQSNLIATRRL